MEVGWQSKSPHWIPSERRIAVFATTSALGLLMLMAIVLWGRRLLGAFADSPSATVLLTALFVLVATSWLFRVPVFRAASVDRPTLYFLLFGTSISLLLSGTLLTDVFTQPAWAWLTFWGVMISSESFIYRRIARRIQRRPPQQRPLKAEVHLHEESELPEEVCQQFVRSTDPELGEIIHGKWRARFQTGQRTESIHLSFCPPLPSAPQLEVETVSGPAASTKPALVVPHGARIDIRLDQPAEEQTDVVLEVFVHQG
ncbi:MAG: hypothetical protein P8N76_24835 [Pirellulaceae bacterium]|nr:hypothetical protein [Pirellulaceae bacterium]